MNTIELKQEAGNVQVHNIRNYYQLHARFYQATRWSFLFGRKHLIKMLNIPNLAHKTIVEAGCGTGHNLSTIARRYPHCRLVGIDISPEMLGVAARRLKHFSRRVFFLEKPYSPGQWELPVKPDVILFSYCLTMINPGWESALQRASDDLCPGDTIAVVDFHGSPFRWFRRWMGMNHVRMEEHLLPVLSQQFTPLQWEIRKAYGGLWSYFLFVGKKK